MLSLEELRVSVAAGDIDTVIVAITDMQGRLQGKRFHARYFLDEVVAHRTEACAYLLAVDTDMNTVDGYELASWETGYGDFVLVPDWATLRVLPWQPGTALVLADVTGLATATAPRATPSGCRPARCCGRSSTGRRNAAGPPWPARSSSSSSSRAATSRPGTPATGRSSPANRYNADYSVLGTGRIEPLLRDIRNSMAGAGLYVESAKGECNLGQHEIAFRYDGRADDRRPALDLQDRREGDRRQARVRPDVHGQAERAGRQLLPHPPVVPCRRRHAGHGGRGPDGLSPAGASMIAGLLAGLRELTLLLAPTINSYKRFAPGSFAPTAVAWGPDNRTCALRLVGHGPSLRVECRVPGGDVNPYLALAGLVAAALPGSRSRGRCKRR